ncbi:MAG: hypothetical protein IJY28_00890 [Clostridia bacterium]|nr:hypothetical protein [Clostridia bacterium]
MKYKVCFSGFAYVEADTPEEAEELFLDDDDVYRDEQVDSAEEVDEFIVQMFGSSQSHFARQLSRRESQEMGLKLCQAPLPLPPGEVAAQRADGEGKERG